MFECGFDDHFRCFDLAQIDRKRERFGSVFRTAAATSSSAFAFRAASTKAQKSRANRMAVDRPMPWLAPVTIATESFIRFSNDYGGLTHRSVEQIRYARA